MVSNNNLMELLNKYEYWDLAIIQVSGNRVYHEFSCFKDYIKGCHSEVRKLKFYPLRKSVSTVERMEGESKQDFDVRRMKIRYEEAITMKDISSQVSLEDFKKPENRIIGGKPIPSRQLIFFDEWAWSGTTLRECKSDFLSLGYQEDNMWCSISWRLSSPTLELLMKYTK